ncbi:MAG: hypothetical protein EKK37_04135 [Sphingobacteriales bacterium]|nr:MAG: hypothetical protein EKK37_04135 [Sphingobacteriales bacterium]
MKKFLTTIIAFIYLISTIGATVHLHYCMDKLVDWGFMNGNSDKKACPYCGMTKSATDKHCAKESKGCCKDEKKIVKLENDQKVSDATFQFTQISSDTISHTFHDYSFKCASALAEKFPVTHAPPRTQGVLLFVRNCVFRI